MTQVPLDSMSLLACVVAAMMLGSLWFGPLFGKTWMKLSGLSKDKMTAAQKKDMWKSYVLMALGSLVCAYVLQHVLVFANTYMNAEGAISGIHAGFWSWLGFIAPSSMGMVLWEGKPWKLWCIVSGYWLVQLMLTGVILAIWQ